MHGPFDASSPCVSGFKLLGALRDVRAWAWSRQDVLGPSFAGCTMFGWSRAPLVLLRTAKILVLDQNKRECTAAFVSQRLIGDSPLRASVKAEAKDVLNNVAVYTERSIRSIACVWLHSVC